MKLIQELEQSVIPKSFSYGDKHYLTISTLIYSDINTKEVFKGNLLWKEVNDYVRESQGLDEGYLKSNGEILIYGDCFSKEYTTVKEVGFKLKCKEIELEKYLDIIGNRELKKNFLGHLSISEPEKFKKLKITYENSYGGGDFKKNPLGKGFTKSIKFNQKISMPNIENKDNLQVTYNNDKAVPYCFEPLSMNWDGRVEKLGTYDENWRKNYWPYFAQDINFNVFNTAPSDQIIKGYFKGDESFELYNMHPVHSKLSGQLPRKSVKIFVTKEENEVETFMQLESNIDTIIVFPELEKLVSIHRAIVEVPDDEYTNIKKVFTVTEDLDEKKHELKYYEELQEKRIDDPLDIKKSFNNSIINTENQIELKDFSLLSEISLQKQLEELPNIHMSSKGFKEFQGQCLDLIEEQLKHPNLKTEDIDNLNKLKELTNKNIFNDHINKEVNSIQNDPFTKAQMDKYQKKHPDINIKEKFDESIENIKNTDELKQIEENGFECIIGKTWSDMAKFFLADMNQNLKNNKDKYKELSKLGLREIVISNILYIGYNSSKKVIRKNEWIENEEDIEIDVGFIIGYFEGKEVKKVSVRKNIFKDEKYLKDIEDIEIKGSKDCQVILKSNNTYNYIILVDEILEAYLLYQSLWQIADVLVIKDKETFEDSDYFEKNKEKLDFIFTTKFDLKYENIKTYNLNIEDNIYKSYCENRDFEQEILEQLPNNDYNKKMKKELKKKRRLGPKYFSVPNVKNQEDRINEKYLDNFTKITSNDDLMKHLDSKDKEIVLKRIKEIGTTKYNKMDDIRDDSEIMKEINKNLNDIYKKNPTEGLKKSIKKFVSNLENLKEYTKKNQKKNNDLKNLENKHFDDEKKFHHQNEIIEYYSKSFDFISSIIEIPKLENLEFVNCDFSNSSWNNSLVENLRFINCKFENSSFNSCTFINCLFEKSDMNNISIISSELENSTFSKTSLDELTLTSSELILLTIDSCSIQDSIFSDNEISKSSLKLNNFTETSMINNIIKQSDFTSSDFTNSIFIDNTIEKSNFKKSSFYKANFTQTDITQSDFSEVNGNTIFFGKDLKFSNIDFSKSIFDNSYFQETIFEDVNFNYSSMKNSIIQKCILKHCNMNYINATKTSFERSEFNNCDVTKLNLLKGDLRKTHLIDSSFFDSNLFECNIFNTKFKRSSFENCNLKRTNLEENKERYINEN
jgi:uncharacterized protein YjbI with pentapeptide repeats